MRNADLALALDVVGCDLCGWSHRNMDLWPEKAGGPGTHWGICPVTLRVIWIDADTEAWEPLLRDAGV